MSMDDIACTKSMILELKGCAACNQVPAHIQEKSTGPRSAAGKIGRVRDTKINSSV